MYNYIHKPTIERKVTAAMKKIISMLIALILVLTAMSFTVTATAQCSEMYVVSKNGKGVNVRAAPSKQAAVLRKVDYGEVVLVDWSYAGNDGWTQIFWGSWGDGYIMSRYLVDYQPGPAPAPKKDQPKKTTSAVDRSLEAELASEKAVAEPFYIAARPTRTLGWINFRTGPATTTSRIRSMDGSTELTVVAETNNWYKALDPQTNRIGYISKNYSVRLAKQYIAKTVTDTDAQKLGQLNVNGEFDLSCKLPEGYELQVVNVQGGRIIASILPADITKPQMYLSIAFDETYADVERMNDLSENELALLEETYSDMNEVAITYRETGYGTKLLVAREIGSDVDFVDILAIYKGYFIEFNMTPNPNSANQSLSDAQVQMCIDFLTNLNFTPVAK